MRVDLKVLHVIPSLAAAHGGPSRMIELMERALTRRGIDVETATTDDDGFGRRNGKPCAMPLHENGVIRRYFSLRLNFYKVSPGFARWIFRHAGDYDLLHIHALFSFPSVIAATAARRAGVPYVIRPLGTLNRYGVTARRPRLKRLSLKLIEAPILRHAAAVHFTSEAERIEAEELRVPMQSAVIALGEEPPESSDPSAIVARFPELAGSRNILFLSRLDPKKNVEGLLKAFALCCGDLTDARLVIAGDGSAGYVASLRLLATRLGFSDRVTWTGHLSGELKASAFASARVFALPSLSENFGISVVEAMMAGLPCVLGSGVAIAGTIAQAQAGLIVEVNHQSIARGLVQLMTNEPLRALMATNAARLAREQFSTEAMGASLADLYARHVTIGIPIDPASRQ